MQAGGEVGHRAPRFPPVRRGGLLEAHRAQV